MKQQPFGRRAIYQTTSVAIKAPAVNSGEPHSEGADATEQVGIGLDATQERSLEDELYQWKRDRRKHFGLPWRQILLMASVCFGVGSFVLPDLVNDTVQWLLLGLAALGLIAGLSARRKSQV